MIPCTVWALVALHVPALLWARSVTLRGDPRAFPYAYSAQSQVQLWWLLLLTWYVAPVFPVLSAGLMFGMAIGWAFNDAQTLYDARISQAQYVFGVVGVTLALALADLTGARGLVHAARTDGSFVVSYVASQVALLTLCVGMVTLVGRLTREREEERQRVAALGVEHERLSVEHRTLRRLAGLLERGVSAGQFSHDVASPITVAMLSAEMLDDSLPQIADDDARLRAEGNLRDIRAALGAIQDMSRNAMDAIRGGGAAHLTTVDDLLDGACGAAVVALRGHQRSLPPIERHCAAASLAVTPLHTQSLGNLLCNGALHQSPDVPIELRGRVVVGAYELRIRDHGVAAAERPQRIADIRRSFSLAVDAEQGPRSAYRGYGMGLLLARTLVMATGGALDVEEPDEGNGIVVVVTLPLDPFKSHPGAPQSTA